MRPLLLLLLWLMPAVAAAAQDTTFTWATPSLTRGRTSYGVLTCSAGPSSVLLHDELHWVLRATRRDLGPVFTVLASGTVLAGSTLALGRGNFRLSQRELADLLAGKNTMSVTVDKALLPGNQHVYVTISNGAGRACTAFGVFTVMP